MSQVETGAARQDGLWISKARHHHLVSGSAPDRGGTGEAWSAGELLLAALTSCANSIVADEARKATIPLRELVVSARSEKNPDAPTHYAFVELDFVLTGADQAQAERLVARFQESCPIYGTVSRGAVLRTLIRVIP